MQIDPNVLSKKLKSFNNTITKPCFDGAVTTSMPRTFLLGNGDISVISSGGKTYKEYLFGKGDFWSCGDMKTDAVMNFDTRRVSILPVGSLAINNLSSSKKFSEAINIRNGNLTTDYDDFKISAICHTNKNAILLTVSSKIDRAVEFVVKAKNDQPEYPCSCYTENGNMYVQRATANYAKNNKNSWTSAVAMSLSSVLGELNYLSHTDSEIRYSLNLKANQNALLILAFGGGGRTYDNQDKLIGKAPFEDIEAIKNDLSSAETFKLALDEINAWWKEYWLSSFIDISDYEMEKYYYTSLYLMACCSRENKMPPGLYGNFITTDNPKWNGDFHMNYNFIAPFYGMYAANRPEFSKCLVEPILDFIPEGKRRAKTDLELVSNKYINGGIINKLFFKGRRDLKSGIENAVLYPVALGPYGHCVWNSNGGYLSQMNDAAFTAMGITAYYFYTLDGDYLNKIREFLELNVNFFLKWREKETLPNNNYRYNLWSGAQEGTFEMNSPGVIACIKNILLCLLDGERRGYISPEDKKLSNWKDFFEHLPDYPIRERKYGKFFNKKSLDVIALGEKGLIACKGEATVPLEFIHPGEDMSFSSDEKIKQASRNAITAYKDVDRDTFRQINNLPKIFIHAIRCGYDANKVYKEFKRLYSKDFMINYSVKDFNNTHGIEKAGGIEFINSMLLSSDLKTVKVFPNWLMDKDAEFCNMLARGAFLVSSKYCANGHNISFIKIKSLVQNKISVYNEFKNPVVKNSNGKFIAFDIAVDNHGNEIICFNADINESYSIGENNND